ncbi:MAG TPA: squalene/phytoene synthase family protein [Vicinamibacterales bacterium]|nr:squalene/phytoene synthase family protein [Vicinamibacterales bacterium]
MTRKTSFYYSFLVLPAPKRRAITAVFDICRAIDDAVDLETDQAKAAAALAMWRAEIGRVFERGTPETPEGRALQPFVDTCHLPRAQFEALIDGVAMDAAPRRFETFADLEPYCHRVASSVGLMCAEIFEYREKGVLDYARDLGVALQLTNILRDVAVDYRRGRFYLPLEDLARFGCTEADIAREVGQPGRGIQSPQVKALLDHQAARARVFFARAVRALPKEDARRFLAAEIMRAIYWELLAKIEANQCDVFTAVIRIPRSRQARLALRTWWSLGR